MYYEINVSKDGGHVFATAKRSLTNLNDTTTVFVLFQHKFPEEDGYVLKVSRYEEIGTEIILS